MVSGSQRKIKTIFIKQSITLAKKGALIHRCNKKAHNHGQIINDIPNTAQNNHRFKARSLWSLDISLNIDCIAHIFHAVIQFIILENIYTRNNGEKYTIIYERKLHITDNKRMGFLPYLSDIAHNIGVENNHIKANTVTQIDIIK